MEKYPQTVAWQVHVREQETITYHVGGAALGQDTGGGGSLHPWRCSSPATTATNLILQGKINNVKRKAKAKLFGAGSRRERKMLLSFFHMRRLT